ncbi:MAG TPA: transposase, partial [Micromonosporaceae bacterium]|nr:transposase [Micromonosporaceae bacterium]
MADAVAAGMAWCQIWDIAAVRLETVHWLLPRRRCGCCRKTTTASVPFGQAGAVTYGLNVNAAAVLLGSAGHVPVERTAMLMEALLGTRVSTGFVARAHERLAEALAAAGFDEAMRDALAAEPVLCGDETPVNVARKDTDEQGQPVPGSPHVVCLRTPEARLVWYRALPARTKQALRTLGLFSPAMEQGLEQARDPQLDLPDPGPGGWFTGSLVRDDYAAWHQFDPHLAGVQQCIAHVFRHCQAVLDTHPTQQAWAGQVRDVLREAHAAVQAAQANGVDHLDPTLLTDLRDRYTEAISWGQTTNRHRDWPKGNHPGYNLAHRLATKTDQVWLFTKDFAVPWTNNA